MTQLIQSKIPEKDILKNIQILKSHAHNVSSELKEVHQRTLIWTNFEGTWFIVVEPDNLKWKSTGIKREVSGKLQSETPFTHVVPDICLILGQTSKKKIDIANFT